MKQYTHAWIAMMAIKRLDKAVFAKAKDRKVAASLVEWLDPYRDNVIKGAWYPDAIIKDMSTGHILKHIPDEKAKEVVWRKLPKTYYLNEIRKGSPYYNKNYRVDSGNLTDRCEALTHSVVDNMKMLYEENKGSSFPPSSTHVAAILFMLSHYIADAHMPLHCDARQYSDKLDVHAKIEDDWDQLVRKCYKLEARYSRFGYDPEGFPLKIDSDPIIDRIEEQIVNRPFDSQYGTKNSNTWDFMSAVTQYSYLTAYEMIPATFDPGTVDYNTMISNLTQARFDELSQHLLTDAIDSVSKVWFRAWNRYLEWESKRKKEKVGRKK